MDRVTTKRGSSAGAKKIALRKSDSAENRHDLYRAAVAAPEWKWDKGGRDDLRQHRLGRTEDLDFRRCTKMARKWQSHQTRENGVFGNASK